MGAERTKHFLCTPGHAIPASCSPAPPLPLRLPAPAIAPINQSHSIYEINFNVRNANVANPTPHRQTVP